MNQGTHVLIGGPLDGKVVGFNPERRLQFPVWRKRPLMKSPSPELMSQPAGEAHTYYLEFIEFAGSLFEFRRHEGTSMEEAGLLLLEWYGKKLKLVEEIGPNHIDKITKGKR